MNDEKKLKLFILKNNIFLEIFYRLIFENYSLNLD